MTMMNQVGMPTTDRVAPAVSFYRVNTIIRVAPVKSVRSVTGRCCGAVVKCPAMTQARRGFSCGGKEDNVKSTLLSLSHLTEASWTAGLCHNLPYRGTESAERTP